MKEGGKWRGDATYHFKEWFILESKLDVENFEMQDLDIFHFIYIYIYIYIYIWNNINAMLY
jgi:hypothetical protein